MIRRALVLLSGLALGLAAIALLFASDPTEASASLAVNAVGLGMSVGGCSDPQCCTPSDGGTLDGGQRFLLCDGFNQPDGSAPNPSTWTTVQGPIVSPFSPTTNYGCAQASNVNIVGGNLVLTLSTSDGGCSPDPIDASYAFPPLATAGSVESRATLTPSAVLEYRVMIPGGNNSLDPTIWLLDAHCQGPPNAPPYAWAAFYPPYSPGNGCTEGVSSFMPEIDPFEYVYSVFPTRPYHNLYTGSLQQVNNVPAIANLTTQFHIVDEVIVAGTSTAVWWDDVLKDTITSAQVPTAPMFIMAESRALGGGPSYAGPQSDMLIDYIRACSYVPGLHSCGRGI